MCPRINIDDDLYLDHSFIKLLIKVQSKRLALGMVVEAFTLAQEHFLAGASERLVPLSEWKRNGMADELIEVGFAEVREKGVYVRGSEKQFAWLLQKQEAGRKGGLAKAHINEIALAGASGCLADASASKPPPPTLPLPLPLSHSLTHSHSQINTKQKKPRVAKALVASEFDLESLYEKYPLKKGKANGLKQLLKQVRTFTDYQAFSSAVDAYVKNLISEGTDKKYIQHFSTFVGTGETGPWRDWLDQDAGKSLAVMSQSQAKPVFNRAEQRSQANKETLNNYLASLKGDQNEI